MNKQREVIYGFRNEIIHCEDVRDRLMDVMEEVVVQKFTGFSDPDKEAREWNLRGMADWMNMTFPVGVTEEEFIKVAAQGNEAPVPGSLFDGMSPAQLAVADYSARRVREAYELKSSFENADAIRSIERFTILSAIDKLWQEHLYFMDSLRNAIGLRAYGQRDPLLEYKAEAFKTFEELMINIKSEICHNIFRSASSLMAFEQFLRNLPQNLVHSDASTVSAAPPGKASDMVTEASDAVSKAKPVRTGPKVGRNDPCPCGSGKKFKQCCGK